MRIDTPADIADTDAPAIWRKQLGVKPVMRTYIDPTEPSDDNLNDHEPSKQPPDPLTTLAIIFFIVAAIATLAILGSGF